MGTGPEGEKRILGALARRASKELQDAKDPSKTSAAAARLERYSDGKRVPKASFLKPLAGASAATRAAVRSNLASKSSRCVAPP